MTGSPLVGVLVPCNNCETGCTACDGEGEVVRHVPEAETYLSSTCRFCGDGIYFGPEDEFWMHSSTGDRECPRKYAEPAVGGSRRRWMKND